MGSAMGGPRRTGSTGCTRHDFRVAAVAAGALAVITAGAANWWRAARGSSFPRPFAALAYALMGM